MNRKTVFVAAYIIVVVVAFLAYALLYNYSYSKYEEWVAIQEAKWIARGFSAEFYLKYVQEGGFLSTVWGKNVISVGFALILGSTIGAIVLFVIPSTARRETHARKEG